MMKRSFALPVVVVVGLFMAGCSPAYEAITHLDSSNNNKFIDCRDVNDLKVSGDNNNLKVKGHCGTVRIEGSNSNVLLSDAERVLVEGSNNNVVASGTAEMKDTGHNNHLATH